MVQETPLPKRQMGILMLVRICEPVSMSVLFPFVYFMVRDFNITENPKEIGFYVGIVASAFSIAQLVTGMIWGYLADRVGRRPILLLGIFGTAICSLSFGLSHSLAWAVTTRALWGGLNGNASVSKTIVGEITDDTNQARGFSMLPLCWNLGTILGPLLGGLLSNPVDNFPSLFGQSTLFRNFPYLLPCMVCSIISGGGFILAYFYLEETLGKPLPKAVPEPMADTSSTLPHSISSATMVDQRNPVDNETREDQPLLDTAIKPHGRANNHGTFASSHAQQSSSSISELSSASESVCESGNCASPKPLGLKESLGIALNQRTLQVIGGYCLLSLVAIMIDEMFPVWAATGTDLGGLGMTTSDIGIMLSVSSVSVLYLQLFIYPKMQRWWGALLCFRWGTIFFGIAVGAFPFISAFAINPDSTKQLLNKPIESLVATIGALANSGQANPATETLSWPIWVGVIMLLIGRVTGGVLMFTSSNILVNNSVPNRQVLGTVNGFNQCFGSLARGVGPILAGTIWSWSLASGYGFPLDYHLVFIVIAGINFANGFFTLTWDPRVNHRIFAEPQTN
ncbi:hypothetical protein IWQ62_000079 [Dispira parvispora]|uniref:Major facilitator superfamily (MFS) profile domain-containing protein n=1 Tax=Dispira parvispora TaxID=1520584 RepID=A0A9W8AZ58_9FUNG|nr:hypothetical protein IWQ62_000079 [Dispira parvispora]